jgi:hypothetical protein
MGENKGKKSARKVYLDVSREGKKQNWRIRSMLDRIRVRPLESSGSVSQQGFN